MSRTLYLIRHADAQSEGDPSDKERVLTSKGREQSEALGLRFREKGYEAQLALVSSATRCRQTFEHMNLDVEMKIREDLYDGAPDIYKGALAGLDDQLTEVMIIGHNPSCAMLAIELCGQGTPADLLALRGGYGKGQMTVMHFNAPGWSDISSCSGFVSDIIHPDQLRKGAV